jgi:hypothetical protein
MAEVNHFIATASTRSEDEDATWVEPTNTCKILGSSLTAGTKYLIIARGYLNGDSATAQRYLRVSTADDATIADRSMCRIEPGTTATTYGQNWMFVQSYTATSATDIMFEQYGQYGFTYIDQLSLILIDLDDLGSDNYVENDDNGNRDLAADGTQVNYIDSLDLDGATEYLFLGRVEVEVDSTSKSHRINLERGSVARTTVFREGEDASENLQYGVMGAWTTAATPQDARLVGYSEGGSAAASDSSYIIAIKVDAFEDFQYSYDAIGVSVDNPPLNTIETFSYTPSTSGDHLVLGRFNFSAQSSTQHPSGEVTVDGTSVQAGDDAMFSYGGYDPTDEAQVNIQGIVDISAQVDIDLNAAADTSTAIPVHEFVAVLNLNLVEAGPAPDVPHGNLLHVGT